LDGGIENIPGFLPEEAGCVAVSTTGGAVDTLGIRFGLFNLDLWNHVITGRRRKRDTLGALNFYPAA
jgi:hypothetical protein